MSPIGSIGSIGAQQHDGVRRGRPRSTESTSDILSAPLELVADVGIAGLTMDAVALRAGVGKATIYRRWSSKEALMLDAWISCVQTPAVPDTGNLRDDVVALLGGQKPLEDRMLRRVFPQMIAAAKVNAEVADAYREFIEQRRRPMRIALERALARGEIDRDADLEVVLDLLVAPLLYRWLVTDAPVDAAMIDRVINTVIAGITPAPGAPVTVSRRPRSRAR